MMTAASAQSNDALSLSLRRRSRTPDGWQQIEFRKQLPAIRTALLICDMWDRHWCARAAIRMHSLVPRIEAVLGFARSAGVQIIHAPSSCMPFYKDYPERRRAQNSSHVLLPVEVNLQSVRVPIDDSDEVFEIGDRLVTRQNINITIAGDDIISDDGNEIYGFLSQRSIRDILYVGVHSNKCILDRSFGIRQMVNFGMNCTLVRDLTDAIYSPRKWPYVSRARAAEMIIEYIEQYWCSTIVSADLISAFKAAQNQ
ncbi:isochorismatase family protein [Bradyrhizobium sp. BWC-3-1]|uniref:isochorismatase family protein n=1 Tax=Bradyrhizobium sp. BWC-3-1 TaxID=3080012 RepID=UPI00293ED5AE|nr:isochorismatase family protein [Bradyrhizobium sp. BWC-3-1]WOH57000.1 isochorismatase family protein [Bradyrhizobium sp. BWC-3-1]